MEEDLFECAACAPNVQSMRAHREWLAAKVNDQGEEIARLKGALAASELVRGQMTSRALSYEAGLREIVALEVSNCDMTGVMAEAARRTLKATEWPSPSATAAPCGCRESTPADRLHPAFYPCPEHTASATAAPAEEEKCPNCRGSGHGQFEDGGNMHPDHPRYVKCPVCPGRAPSRGEVGT